MFSDQVENVYGYGFGLRLRSDLDNVVSASVLRVPFVEEPASCLHIGEQGPPQTPTVTQTLKDKRKGHI